MVDYYEENREKIIEYSLEYNKKNKLAASRRNRKSLEKKKWLDGAAKRRAEKLRELRKQSGLTQARFGEITNTHSTSISLYENMKFPFSQKKLDDMERLLNEWILNQPK